MSLKIVIDPIACDGYGYCIELLPEMVTSDEWGYPIASDSPVPRELEDLARRAATECPRKAFLLKEERTKVALRSR